MILYRHLATRVMKSKNQVTVTSPLLPPLEEFIPYLQDIWDRQWITNNGHYHQELESKLCHYLGVNYISLFTNGTLPLITALQALRVTGEVITTPYSFVATTHSLWWNGIKPVFADIDLNTGNIDPSKIEAAITSRTTAIMPVHVYGNPCDINRIKEIADAYGLKVIYDAAHAFGVKKDGKSILEAGDLSTLSFHATKTYNTVEGGALICHSEEMKQKIDFLKNFGFKSETEVVAPGINSKMDEIRSAYGLLNLKYVGDAIAYRKRVTEIYRENLKDVKGVRMFNPLPGVESNYSYFPVFIDRREYGVSRDSLYEKMRSEGILGRRYFYPLISHFSPYRSLPSSAPSNLPNAEKMASEVICLPLHHLLTDSQLDQIIEIVRNPK